MYLVAICTIFLILSSTEPHVHAEAAHAQTTNTHPRPARVATHGTGDRDDLGMDEMGPLQLVAGGLDGLLKQAVARALCGEFPGQCVVVLLGLAMTL